MEDVELQQITKYQHACLVIAKEAQSLVIDPGGWSDDFVSPTNVVGIVITHEHQDHFDRNKLKTIIAANPAAIIYAPSAVTEQLGDLEYLSVDAGETISVGQFSLQFFGGDHAIIDPGMPVASNVGVLVDSTLYYPGDSFTEPHVPVEILALPISAPWMKFSEAASFLRKIKPVQVFPTHDAILSEVGKSLSDMMFRGVCKQIGSSYSRLDS